MYISISLFFFIKQYIGKEKEIAQEIKGMKKK